MPYIENPKTKGSGIICAIPQKSTCPVKCKDCFFQSGRSYLEPLKNNLPNMPSPQYVIKNNLIVRVNDGNDSSYPFAKVIHAMREYPQKFYNTSSPHVLDRFNAPVVLTVNPGEMTDSDYHEVDPIPINLMFVRVRVNTWNISMTRNIVKYYTSHNIPVVLTFMAYYSKKSIPNHSGYITDYIFRKRTLNSYYAITSKSWSKIMDEFKWNNLVYSCGHIEGEKGNTKCKYCGNCLREYFACIQRMREAEL